MTLSLTEYATSVEAKYPVLGRLMWYSMSELRVLESDLKTYLHNAGLPDSFMPASVRGVDAFRKATKAAEMQHRGAVRENYLLREVACDDDVVMRNIVLEKVDPSGRKLEYDPQLAVVVYTRKDDNNPKGRVELRDFSQAHDDYVRENVQTIFADVLDKFKDYSDFFHSTAIRTMTGKILRSCSTITVRASGGVYFAPIAYQPRIEGLQTLFRMLGPGCQFHSLPLIDEADQRSMLVAAFEDESIKEVERELDEIAIILKNGKGLTGERYAQIVNEYHRLKARAVEYSDLLDLQMSRVGTSLTMLDKQVVSLLNSVK